MRKLLAALLLWAIAAPVWCAIDVGQASAGAFGGVVTTITTTAITTSASGSSFFIAVADDQSSSRTVSDNKSNTYTQVGPTLSNAFGFGVNASLYLCTSCTGGSGHTATVTFPTAADGEIYLIEIVGGASSSLVDVAAASWSSDTSSPFTSNSITTTNAADLILAITVTITSGGTEILTWGNSFTQVSADGNTAHFTGGIAKLIVGSTGTYNSTFTSAGGGATAAGSAVISFKAAGGGGSCTHNFWKSTGAFAQPDGTTGSYWSSAGAFATPNCTSGSYWRQDGTFNSN